MDYAKYITARDERSARRDSLIDTLRRDEDSLAARKVLTGEDKLRLNAASLGKIEDLVGNYLSGNSIGELSQISSIYGNTNAVSTTATTSGNTNTVSTATKPPVSALDSLDKTYSSESLRGFDAEEDIELSKSLTLNLKGGKDVSSVFEEQLLDIVGDNLGNATFLKEENINGATVKTYKSTTGSEFTINTKETGNDTYSTLTYSDGSTLMLRYENGGAGGVAVQRGSSSYEAGQAMDYTYVNADVVQQGTSALKTQDNGEQAWVNEYSQVGIKDNSKLDNVTSTYYSDGTSTTVWEDKGKTFAGFGSGNNKVYEQYSSDDDFTQAMQKIVGLDENGIFKGYVDEDELDLNDPYYGDYRAQIDKRKLEIFGLDPADQAKEFYDTTLNSLLDLEDQQSIALSLDTDAGRISAAALNTELELSRHVVKELEGQFGFEKPEGRSDQSMSFIDLNKTVLSDLEAQMNVALSLDTDAGRVSASALRTEIDVTKSLIDFWTETANFWES